MTAPMMRKRNSTPHRQGVSKKPAMTRMTPTRRSALRFPITRPGALGPSESPLASAVRLAHPPAPWDVDVDVDRVNLPSREFQRLEDLEASELELIHLDRDAVDPHDPAAFREGRPRHRRLPLPTGDDGLHADPPNLEPRRVAISPRLMYGPWGGRFATSIVSRGFSLNSSGTDK